jgi:LytS/YehU family sensor histidine kinase
MDIYWIGIYCGFKARELSKQKQVRLELALREAELRALEAQINPHFLFNCLNSIRALVIEDPPKAQDMITRFATLLRYNLNHESRHTVPLSAEAEVVADYLALEKVRFEDRLRLQIAIDPAVASLPVPPMILQTLVENALKHGIARLPQGANFRFVPGLATGRSYGSGEQWGVDR